MKLSVLLTCILSVNLMASVYSQNARFDLNIMDQSVRDVLKTIEKESQFRFFYNDEFTDLDKKLTISTSNQSIDGLMSLVLDNLEVSYKVLDNNFIVITPKSLFQQSKVTGTVTDAKTGEPLIGVNVVVTGTTLGTMTDIAGKYSIDVPQGSKSLTFTFIGMESQEITIGTLTQIDLTMAELAIGLDEVVVIGYGTQKKINLTGAADVVSSKTIESRPSLEVLNILQGIAPNLNITTNYTGGEMGATKRINIRGVGSINGGSPYILVDGIEQSLDNVNPNDIESITVLKDASTSAIYGARAAFGVILVTTKKGAKDGVSVTYSNQFMYKSPIHLPSIANSILFAQYINEAAKNDGQPDYSVFKEETIEKMIKWQAGEIPYNEWNAPNPGNPAFWYNNRGSWGNFDWYKETFRDWVPSSNHNLSVRGGNERTQFYVSGATFDEQGLFRTGDDSYKRNSFNITLNTKVHDILRFNLNSKLTRKIIDLPSYDRRQVYDNLPMKWPTALPYYPDGNRNFGGYVSDQIFLEQAGRWVRNSNELIIIPGIEIEPVKDWVIYGNYRWKLRTNGYSIHIGKVSGTNAVGDPYILNAVSFFESQLYDNYYNSPNIWSTFNKTLGGHDFKVMGGFEQEEEIYNSVTGKKTDLITDALPSINTALGTEYATGSMGHWAMRSFFGRFNYNYMGKYLFEFALRRDGSSKFAENHRWGTFPSASAGYIISNEPFWDPIKKYVNLLKFRGSYGSLGNQDVANYLYVERIPITKNLNYIFNNERPLYAGMANLISADITWEKIKTLNFGIDANFMANRLTVKADYFNRETFDMLGPSESVPSVLGIAMPKSNNATLLTKGFEVVLDYTDNIGDLRFNVVFMLSNAISEVTKYLNPDQLLSAAYYEGKKLGEIWGFTTVGLFQTDAEADEVDQSYLSKETWRSGDVKYADINDDGKIDIGKNTVGDSGDLSIIGNSTPRYPYSARLNLNWKGFDFNVFLQGIGKRDLVLGGLQFWGALGGIWGSTCFKEHLDYWTPDNPDAYYPRPYLSKGAKNHQIQTRYLQNGAYLRLKSMQLGYTVPSSLTQRVYIKNLKVLVSGENLLTLTKLNKIFDPEGTEGYRTDGGSYPLQKFISFGVNVTF